MKTVWVDLQEIDNYYLHTFTFIRCNENTKHTAAWEIERHIQIPKEQYIRWHNSYQELQAAQTHYTEQVEKEIQEYLQKLITYIEC